MKLILLISCLGLATLCLVALPAQSLTKDEVFEQLMDKVAELDRELGVAERASHDAITKADSLKGELNTAQEQANRLESERDGWKAYGEDRNEKWMNAEVRVAKAEAIILRRNIIIAGLLLLITLYIGIRLYLPRLPI